MVDIRYAMCRFCHAFCGLKVEVENDRITSVIGDKHNPMYFGYSCIKGRQLPAQHYIPERLAQSVKRQDSGEYTKVASETLMDEVASRLTSILDQHGPRAVAMYSGTFSHLYPTSGPMSMAFMDAIESPMRFSSGTIDQPGKSMSMALHGRWNAGPRPFAEADVWMFVGTNPLISMWGTPQYSPAKRMHDARKRGMKTIVIDPRRTECAEKADIFLQCKPGEDPTILAGIARVIIKDKLQDTAFIQENVEGFDALRDSVEPYTPDYVQQRAGVPAEMVIEAARLFGSAISGDVTVGTGPNMSPRGTLTEYMGLVIATLCGRWMREGEKMPNPFVLMPERRGKAQCEPKPVTWGFGEKLRVRNLTNSAAGLSTAALADEILMEGEGQVKALISVGGNPMAVWPDQLKTYEAMKILDLNITLDIVMSATAKLADYVVAPKLSLEQPSMTILHEALWIMNGASAGYPEPFAQYHPAIVPPPIGSDLLEEWEFFYGLAQRMGLSLRFSGELLDMENKPSIDDLFEILTRGSRVPLSEVKKYPHGHIFDDPSIKVLPKDAECGERLDIGNSFMMDELHAVQAETLVSGGGYREGDEFSHRLVSRRMHGVYNSGGRDIPALKRNGLYNPAYMNPLDLEALGLSSGDMVEIISNHSSILGVVEGAADILDGVVSMAHGFGDAPEYDNQVRHIGSNTGRLTSVDKDFDPHTGIPMMSAIPVNIRAVEEPSTKS